MRKKIAFLAAFGLLAAGGTLVLADEMPPGMQMPKPKPKPKTAQAQPQPAPQASATGASHDHMQGMDHGGAQMHEKMMHDHNMGMQQGQQPAAGGMAPQSGQAPMPMSSGTPKPMPSGSSMPMKPGKGCC